MEVFIQHYHQDLHTILILVVYLSKKKYRSYLLLAQEIMPSSGGKVQLQSFVQSLQHRRRILESCSSVLGDFHMVVSAEEQEARAFAVEKC